MALENIKEVEELLGVAEGSLLELITSEETHNLDISNRLAFDKSVYEERVANIRKESATAAVEMAVKEQKRTLGLEFTGKSMDNLITAIKDKVEAESKIEPEEKYKNLKTDFEKLQQNLLAKENEFTEFKTTIEREKTISEIKNDFTKHIPENTLVSKSTIFTEAKEQGFSFEREEGKTVVKKNGEVIKDEKTLSPVDISQWVTSFVTPYLAKPNGGAGQGDADPPAKAGTYEALLKEAEINNWNAQKLNEEVVKRTKDGTLKL